MYLKNKIRKYIQTHLVNHAVVGQYLSNASIVFRGSTQLGVNDEFCDWDLEFLLPSFIFIDFAKKYGRSYVLIDKKHNPEVFMVVRPHQWLKSKFTKNPIVWSWNYQELLIVKDPGNVCRNIIISGIERFQKELKRLTWEKYIEFRAHRHDLKASSARNLVISSSLIRAAMVKSFLEFVLLSHGRPYPHKKWLATVVKKEIDNEGMIVGLCQNFLTTFKKEDVETLDTKLLNLAMLFGEQSGFERKKLETWWCYLS